MRVAAATRDRREDTGENRERPAGGNREPAGVLALRSFQQDTGDDTIAEQNQDEGADELSQYR
jgi:hypothetical protein